MLLISFRGSDVFLMRGRKSVDQDGWRGWKELRGEEFGGRVVRMEICPFVLLHLKLHLIQTSTSPVHIVSIFVNSYVHQDYGDRGSCFLGNILHEGKSLFNKRVTLKADKRIFISGKIFEIYYWIFTQKYILLKQVNVNRYRFIWHWILQEYYNLKHFVIKYIYTYIYNVV